MTKIVTTAGDTIAILETNSLGMGSVPLFIEETDTLFAHTVFEDGSYRRTPLPLPTATKYSLEINNMNPHTLFAQLNLSRNWQTGEDVFFVVHYLGKVYYASSQPASKSALVFSVKKNELPNGVLTVSLLNHRLEPLTERPVFIYDQAGILPLSLRVDAGPGEDSSLPSYARRQKVSLSIESGTPLDTIRNAFLSASVINRSKLPEDRPAAQGGIIASLLLSNDVKGYIEDPGFYIDEEGGVKMGAVDDLLMTQGWRKIDFTAIPNKAGEPAVPAFMPEKGISIRGQVRRQFRKASVPNADLVLIPTHNFMQFIDTVANEEGRFAFDRLFFPDSIDFLITARDESGKNNVDIVVEEETSPAVGVNRNAPGERNNVNSLFVDDILNSKRYFSELESQGFMERSITIREVIITARQRENKAAENSSNFNGPGNADQVISASELSSCSTLEMCLNGRLTGVVFQNGVPYNTRTNGPMQLILDGMYIESDELWMIVPDNVESVEVLRSINYTTVYGSYGTNGVIIITSKIGVDASAREHTPKGIVTVQPKGLHVNKTFYKPVYEPDYEVLFDRDLRTTIHWEPNIVTDLSGVAHFDFYTADEPGEYLITVEGLDIHGRPAQKTLMIEVR